MAELQIISLNIMFKYGFIWYDVSVLNHMINHLYRQLLTKRLQIMAFQI